MKKASYRSKKQKEKEGKINLIRVDNYNKIHFPTSTNKLFYCWECHVVFEKGDLILEKEHEGEFSPICPLDRGFFIKKACREKLNYETKEYFEKRYNLTPFK